MSDRTFPKVSIVTPSFNQGQFIEETIKSIQRQNYPDVEHIIIDGGSKDDTLEKVKKFKDKIVWSSEPDQGQADAVNKGINKATGEIIGWLNSDDVYIGNAITQAVQVFQRIPEADLVYGDFAYIDKNGDILLNRKEIDFDYNILLHGLCYIGQQSTFFRKNVFGKVGYLDVSLQYVMDWELFLRIATNCKRIVHVPQIWAGFRLHSVSKSISRQIMLLHEHDIVKRRYWNPPNYRFISMQKIHAKTLELYYRVKRRWMQLIRRQYFLLPGTSERIFKRIMQTKKTT